MDILIGKYEYFLDEKGRTRIPQVFKDILGDDLLIAEGMGKYLEVFNKKSLEEVAKTASQFRTLTTLTEKELGLVKYYRDIFSLSTEFTADSQKRYRIPKSMVAYAELGSKIIIAGNNQVIEIWSEYNYEHRFDDEIAASKIYAQNKKGI